MCELYVGNLSSHTTSTDLKSVFGRFGTVHQARIVTDSKTGLSQGYGFVTMGDGAERAVKAVNGRHLLGRKVAVAVVRPIVVRRDTVGAR
jgi:RNA recognition motif-containing protein